jgi:hypothetical protein
VIMRHEVAHALARHGAHEPDYGRGSDRPTLRLGVLIRLGTVL